MTTHIQLSVGIIILMAFIWLIYFYTNRARQGIIPTLRPIRAFQILETFSGRAIEAGRALHLSLGVGTLSTESTADTLAGLSVLSYLARQASTTGVPPTISMSDPMVLLYAQNAIRAAHHGNTDAVRDAYRHIRWIAPQPTPYAAGVMNLLSLDRAEANVMVGSFGDEYLLMGEVAARRNVAHIGGTSNPNTLPFIYTSAEETLIGEEIFAAGAYLNQTPSQIGSLVTQDVMRWALISAIFLGVFISTLVSIG